MNPSSLAGQPIRGRSSAHKYQGASKMSQKSSQKRIEANRRNAQKSTGPRTPEGKAKSATNSTAHGFPPSKSTPSPPVASSPSRIKDPSSTYSTITPPLTAPPSVTNSTYSPKPSTRSGGNNVSGSPRPPKSKSPSPKTSNPSRSPSPPPAPPPTSPTALRRARVSSSSNSAMKPNSIATTANASKTSATCKPTGASPRPNQTNPIRPPSPPARKRKAAFQTNPTQPNPPQTK